MSRTNDTPALLADVVSLQVTGGANAYRFSVGIRSPDTGCERYANWWEVVTDDGRLVYRRILTHSHVDEQPFVRSGSPVEIEQNQAVYVRAHMHPQGYGGKAFFGTVQQGFRELDLNSGFAAGLAGESPLPRGCSFLARRGENGGF